MVSKYVIVPTGELYHHGTKGMRWGIRRYQNKDGSLTPAGKKRYAKLEAEMEKLGGKKSDAKAAETETPKTKSVSEMTDQEINDKINRLALEKRYADTVAANNPKPAEPAKPDIERAARKKSVFEMTNAEINARIERIQLEDKLIKLMEEPAATVETKAETKKEASAGRKIVGEILSNSAKNIGQQTMTYVMGAGVNVIARKLFNSTEDIVNPKKGQKDK